MATNKKTLRELEINNIDAQEYSGKFKPTETTFYNFDNQQAIQPIQNKLDENNLFGYPSTQNQGKSEFNQWQDRNVQRNISETGDPNQFNSLGMQDKQPIPWTPKHSPAPQTQVTPPPPSLKQQANQPIYTGNDPVEIAREKSGWYNNGYIRDDQLPKNQPNQVTPETQFRQAEPFIRSMAGQGYGNSPVQQVKSDNNVGVATPYVPKVWDAQGNALSRADLQALDRQRDVEGLIMAARGTGDPSRDMIYQKNAQDVLRTLGGYHGVPLASDIAKDNAAVNKMNIDSSLAPGLAQSEIGLRGAQANRYNVESQYMPQRFAMERQAHNTENNYKQAQIDNLNRKQGMTGRDLAALEKVELDRRIAFNEAYNSAIMNNPKIDKNSLRRDLERQFGLNKAQRRSATEFQN